jgi:hypothetical protein
MVARVIRFVRLPMLLLTIYAVGRFSLGVSGFPYAPRGNAIFSVLGLAIISSFYFGALAGRIGGFRWGGTALVGFSIGLFAQLLIFLATWISFAADLPASYFRHWDSLNAPEGTLVPFAAAMRSRAGGLVLGPVLPVVAALLGRLAGALAPKPE